MIMVGFMSLQRARISTALSDPSSSIQSHAAYSTGGAIEDPLRESLGLATTIDSLTWLLWILQRI